MLSYTNLRTQYGLLTNDSSSDNLTLGDMLMNEDIRQTCADGTWDFLEKTKTSNTVAGTQFYDLPGDYLKLVSASITIGTTKYVPREVPSRQYWDYLNSTTGIRSDIPQFYFIFNGQIGFWPTPATSTTDAITYTYRRNVPDLNVGDYSTGTITTVATASGVTTVTGSGTTWTAPMVGRFIRITRSDVALSGDHLWYEIATVPSTTTLTLDKVYEGTALAAASATYTIGQMPILPEAYHMLPVYYAAATYFTTKNIDQGRAQRFQEKRDQLFDQLKRDHGRKTNNIVVLSGNPELMNSNLFPSDLS